MVRKVMMALALLASSGSAIAQQTVTVGQNLTGDLSTRDARLSNEAHVDRYVIEGRAGQRLELRLNSSAFDPYLQIDGPDGFTMSNDDNPDDGLNSRIVVQLPANGRYTILVTSYAARETGAYRLSIAQAGANVATTQGARAPSRTADARNYPAVRMGANQQGSLASGDERLGSGEYVDGYRFTGRRGQRIAVSVDSNRFDTYAIMYTPSGAQFDNDDQTPGNTNARLERVLPEDGEYRVMVTSYRPGEVGPYTLNVGETAGPPRIANVRSGPRVFALMVGVSDYGGTGNNDLPFTDDDARDLSAALRQQGVLNPASVTLVNSEATVAAVRRAFSQVARQAGPDDLFMFFFSGHGQQEDVTADAIEPDGRNEVIVLRDGNISDDDLASMMREVRARMSLVIIDACYAGGFGRDVVNRPGVMGIWSSEEDLTSLVAERFRAGGYLAHFLRSGFAGQADLNGDRAIDAGELTTYVRRGMNGADVGELEAETREGIANYQYLVVDRGGVMVDDVLFRLNGRAGGRAR